MEEVINRYELVEGARVQTAADLNIVSSQQSHRRSVLLLKHLPLQRRAEQQEVVVCREDRERGLESDTRRNKFTVRIEEKTVKMNSQNMNEGFGLMAKSGR